MIDKRLIAESFGKAAATYDKAARLQRLAGEGLLSLIPEDLVVQGILDVGCGTGYFTHELYNRYPGVEVVGLDLAEGMLDFAATRCPESIRWVCGDAESLPLASQTVDLVFSSLAIQWCGDLSSVFLEMKRVLRPGGVALFTTLADGTLWELQKAWRQVDGFRHVNDFLPVTVIEQLAGQAGFHQVRVQQEQVVLEYADLRDLTGELKNLGARNLNADRPAGMTGRQRIRALQSAYELYRTGLGTLPATWQLVYGCLKA